MQNVTARLSEPVINRLDALLDAINEHPDFQLRGIETRADLIRLVIETGIKALEKALAK
jgi:hypothetical protein